MINDITTHSLRHTAAINMVREGATLTQIRDALGQSSTRVTDVYLDHLSSAAKARMCDDRRKSNSN